MMRFFIFRIFFVVSAHVVVWPALTAERPHVEQVATDIYAAGFADRYGSPNCGWVAMSDHVLLIDLPRGIEVPEFLAEVAKLTGKRAKSLILTHTQEEDTEIISALAKEGVKKIPTPPGRASLGEPTLPVEFIHYNQVAGSDEAAIYLPRQKVLFAGPLVRNGPRTKLAGTETVGWISALLELEKLPVIHVIPGFGSWGGSSLLDRQRSFLLEVRRQVAYRITMAQPLEVIEKEITIAPQYLVWMPYDTPNAEDLRHVYRELTIPIAPYHGRIPDKTDPRSHALVLIGDRVHEPEHIELGLRPVFEATGVIPHFVFDVRALSAENLSPMRLLVMLRDGYVWPEGKGKIWMTPDQEHAVVQFVEGGGGFLNLHNSMGLYPENGPYLKLVGGRYIGHGPLERFRTEVVDPDHPITRGVRDFFTADEQHTPPYDTNKVHLLLQNRSDDGKVVAAAGWAYEPGRGRLCHLANGHTREALLHPMFQRLMRNAVNWCLRQEETGQKPE